MHWQIGEVEMAQRANVPVFHLAGQNNTSAPTGVVAVADSRSSTSPGSVSSGPALGHAYSHTIAHTPTPPHHEPSRRRNLHLRKPHTHPPKKHQPKPTPPASQSLTAKSPTQPSLWQTLPTLPNPSIHLHPANPAEKKPTAPNPPIPPSRPRPPRTPNPAPHQPETALAARTSRQLRPAGQGLLRQALCADPRERGREQGFRSM